MPIVNRVAAMHDDIKAWRHDLHAHPELLFDVHRTAWTLADLLSPSQVLGRATVPRRAATMGAVGRNGVGLHE